jgi:CubicO group peptidase (beta-lactamase class C family)
VIVESGCVLPDFADRCDIQADLVFAITRRAFRATCLLPVLIGNMGVEMRGSGRGLTVAIAALLVAAGCTSGPPAPASGSASGTATAAVHGMTEYLDGLVRARQFRGVVEVRLGDKVLLGRGYGQADVTRDVPNDLDTRFRIASLTKQFTALAVLILQEQGKLEVSDLVCTHLAKCPASWRAITIEHLLTHTAGLFNYTDLGEAEANRYGAEFGPTPTPEQLIQTFIGRPLEFPPGSKSRYSNSGYVLLGHLIERLTGHTYAEFLHDEILDPLGMSDTAYQPDEPADADDAVGYQDWSKPVVDPLSDAVAFAAGGIRSTAADLVRWNQFLLTGTPAIVKPGTLAELLRPRVATGGGEKYGYGIATSGTGKATTHFHDGAIEGFSTYNQIRPATKLSIVVLSNLEPAGARRVGRNLALLVTT